MASLHSELRAKEQKHAEARVKHRARGGAAHSDVKQDKALIASMLSKHDHAMGRRAGGAVDGAAPANRLDRRGRSAPSATDVYKDRPGPQRSTVTHPSEHYVGKDTIPERARGGRTGRTIVNVHTGGGREMAQMAQQQGRQEGMKAGAMMGAKAVLSKMGGGAGGPPGMGGPPMPAPGGAPPMGPPGAGAPPPGMPPMRKAGGKVPAKAVKAVTKPPSLKEAERNKAETGHQELVKVRPHSRRKAGGAV